MLRSFGLGLLAAACLAGPAGAVTFSGTVAFDEFGEATVEGPLVSAPGAYVYDFTIDTPVFAQIELADTNHYDFYDATTGRTTAATTSRSI